MRVGRSEFVDWVAYLHIKAEERAEEQRQMIEGTKATNE